MKPGCSSVKGVGVFEGEDRRRQGRSLSTAVVLALALFAAVAVGGPSAASASQPAAISLDTTKQVHSASGSWSSTGFVNSGGTFVTRAFVEDGNNGLFVVTHVTYEFSDAVGTFQLSAEIRETVTSPGVLTDDGNWQIKAGTGAYRTLQGNGTVTGTVDHQADLVHRIYHGDAHS
jgi:hypothetical protein